MKIILKIFIGYYVISSLIISIYMKYWLEDVREKFDNYKDYKNYIEKHKIIWATSILFSFIVAPVLIYNEVKEWIQKIK